VKYRGLECESLFNRQHLWLVWSFAMQEYLPWIIGGGILVVVALWIISIYNGLVGSRNLYKNAFSQIDVQLKRRNDLIPNLVETVKGYMAHEKDTLEAVINARNQAYNAGNAAAANPGDAKTMGDLNKAEGQLGGALSKLMALTEAYPDLKANQNMMNLQEELSATENRVGFARQAYNDSATKYNTSAQVFPNVVVAKIFGFNQANMFEIENPAEREAPKVKFS
jgi:LemA protein